MKSAEYMKKIMEKKQRLRRYERRLEELQLIRNNYSYFDGMASELNAKNEIIIDRISQGIKAMGGINDAGERFRNRDMGSADGDLNESSRFLNEEIRSVQNYITELERSIRTDNYKMNEAMAREKEELLKNL